MKPQLITLTARSTDELQQVAARLARHLDREPELLLHDLAYTYQIGKKPFAHRLALVAADRDEWQALCLRVADAQVDLSSPFSGIGSYGLADRTEDRVAFLFTGQGAQHSGMGRELYERFPVFRQELDRCAALLEAQLPAPLLGYLFDADFAAQLNETQYTQPALFAYEYALARLWLSWGVRPSVMIGHSLGEYVAACIGGALSLEDALTLVTARGRLMQERCERGAMASVLASEQRVRQDLAQVDGVELSAVNTAQQIVVAGTQAGVDALCARWERDGLTHKRLTVSHAFHSQLMEPMLDEFADLVRNVTWKRLDIPVISNLTGELIEEYADADYWCRHLRQPVQFSAGLETLTHTAGVTICLEIGPHPVLQRFALKTLSADHLLLASADRRRSEVTTVLQALGHLWSVGQTVDWQAVHAGEDVRRVHVPTYPFARQTYSLYREDEWRLHASSQTQATSHTPSAKGELSRTSAAVASFASTGETTVYQTLSGYIEEILGVRNVGPEQNFYDLGGDSLNAIQLQARIRQDLGVDLTLQDLFEIPTIAALSEAIEARIDPSERVANTQGARRRSAIPRLPKRRTYPLSNAQQRMYFLAESQTGETLYNLPSGMILHGPVDVTRLQTAFQLLVDRHEQLRTTFTMEDDTPVQVVADRMTLTCSVEDWRDLVADEQARLERERMLEEARHPFDLATGPLLRVRLITLAADRLLVILNVHHIVFDAWSMGVLLRELDEVYNALGASREPNLPQTEIRYTDYAAWMSEQMETGMMATSRDYWLQHLGGELPVLDLPTDFPRPAKQTFDGATEAVKLDPHLVGALRSFLRQQDTTLYTVLLAALYVLLHRYSGQQDIIVGTSVAGRSEPSLEGLIGMFVNTLAIRADLSDDPMFADFLQQVRTRTLAAFSHQDYPFEKLIEDLNLERDESRPPLFSLMFTLLGGEQRRQTTICNAQATPIEPPGRQSKFDLTLIANEEAHDLTLHLEYNTRLFKPTTIRRLLRHFTTLLNSLVATPDTPVGRLALLTAEESHTLTEAVNNTAASFPDGQTIHAILAERAAKFADNIAIRAGERTLTYRELEARANRLAHHLRRQHVGPDTPVVLLAHRSPELLIALLAVLKAGGAYVPVDPNYPDARIRHLLQTCDAPVALVAEQLADKLGDFDGQALVLERMEELTADLDSTPPQEISSPEDLAYMIFTSGSTGQPKGVQIKHRGLVNYLTWATTYYHAETDGSFPLYSSLAFDLTVTSLYLPLLNGHTLSLQAPELEGTALIARMAETADFRSAKFTPAHLELLLQDAEWNGPRLSSLRRVIVGGEALPPDLLRAWFKHYPQTTVYNEYGPTETVVGCVVQELTADSELTGATVPIGHPVANTQVYLLDEHLQPVPHGVRGEIYIGGAGVARGYFNRPDLTAERFVDNPFCPGMPMYKTGDLGRRLEDGTLEYLGRLDDQVKIRGFRIELGEIESALLQHPAIRECVVTTTPDAAGQPQLIAYLVTTATLRDEEVKAYLARTLPAYMVPEQLVHLAEIPLTVNGKIDRAALPRPSVVQQKASTAHDTVDVSPSPTTAPETELSPLQAWVADLWKKQLGVEHVALEDDFFSLGGHSLKILPIIVQLKKKYPQIQVQDCFTYRTLKDLTEYLSNFEKENVSEPSVTQPEPAATAQAVAPTTPSRPKTLSADETAAWAPPEAVLLTGATGFLGSHVLHDLLTETEARVCCLVRAGETETAQQRLERMFAFYFGAESFAPYRDRIHVFAGDLAAPDLGLSDGQQEALAAQVDAIIHCAADVRHYGDSAAFDNVNVGGTERLLALAKRREGIRFYYVSTISIVGWAADDPAEVVLTENDFDRGQVLDNVYTRSKFEAEKRVRQEMADGLPAAIIRVGNLIAHSGTGHFQQNMETDAFYRILKALLLLGAYADTPGTLDLTPVDYASRSLVALTAQASTIGQTYHLCNPKQVGVAELVQHLQTFGYSLTQLSPEQFGAFLLQEEAMTPEHQEAQHLLVAHLEGGGDEAAGGSVIRIDCQQTAERLDALGIRCPAPDRELMFHLVKYAIGQGFFPAPKFWNLLLEPTATHAAVGSNR
ncbi:MAG TPA: amino acid adenylation domain-containing protein [Bacilli bacterium]|nr:amino acid adenylation domain-containing protein [Bacilli bacterium]